MCTCFILNPPRITEGHGEELRTNYHWRSVQTQAAVRGCLHTNVPTQACTSVNYIDAQDREAHVLLSHAPLTSCNTEAMRAFDAPAALNMSSHAFKIFALPLGEGEANTASQNELTIRAAASAPRSLVMALLSRRDRCQVQSIMKASKKSSAIALNSVRMRRRGGGGGMSGGEIYRGR